MTKTFSRQISLTLSAVHPQEGKANDHDPIYVAANKPRPCHSLIALLLGRLRLSVPQARREYVRIAEEVFSLPRYLKKDKFDGQKLEEAVKRLLQEYGSEEKMLERDGICKV